MKNSLSNENKLNEFIELVNKKYYNLNNFRRSILAKYDIYLPQKNSKINLNIKKNIDNFINENYDKKIYSNEESDLVDRFRNLFLDSDKDIVKLAIRSFYQTYSFDKDRAIRDINLLMWYKENNSEFKLSTHDSMNCFTKEEIHDSYSGTHLNAGISIANKNAINVFDHELGHFLHESLDIDFFGNSINNSSCPNSILDSIYDEVATLYSSLDKEENEQYLKYVGDIDKYKNKLKQEFMQIYNSDNNDYIEYISSLIDDWKVIDKNDLSDIYVNNRIIKEKKFIRDELFRKKYTSTITFINFINDYYNEYSNKKTKLDLPIAFHSNEYFLKKDNAQIYELFASFTALLRDKNGKKHIDSLKSICSSELIDYLYQIDNLISYNYLNTKNNKMYK